MKSPAWSVACSELLSQRREQSLLRERQVVEVIDATHLKIDGVSFVNFSANNYLGLTYHSRVVRAMQEVASAGSGAAGLVTGHSNIHAAAESTIAKWKGTESAVLLPSGYQANLAAVQTAAAIGDKYPQGARFLVDKLAHASLIDAVRSTQAEMRIFPHNNLAKLKRLLEESDAKQLQVVLTESIFSMDGDAAALAGIAELKRSHDFLLLLDEAHASGVYGPNGAGFAAEKGLQNSVDVSIVTLSKAIGCGGGAVCSSTIFRDALLNFGRAYIYSTSVPPVIAQCVQTAIEVMRDEPERQNRLRNISRRVREELEISDGDSPIIPILLGSAEAALKAAAKLKQERLLVIAVRPPTVANNSSRLRLSLSCEHTDDELDKLVHVLKKIIPKITR